jgi:hypothetical protein
MTTPVTGLDLWLYARSLAAWLADRRIIAAQAKLSGRLGVEKFALGAGSGISGSEWHDQSLFSIIRMLNTIRPAKPIGSPQSSKYPY